MTDLQEEHYQAAMAMSEKHRRLWVEASREAKALREALQNFMKVGARPWMDGGVSWPEWDAATTAAEVSLRPPFLSGRAEMTDTKDMAAFAWDGHCIYGDQDSINTVHAIVVAVAAIRAPPCHRPNWREVYRETAHTPDHDNALVVVTRETARLARSAIDAQQEQDGYHNFAAARQELNASLTSTM